MKPKTLIALTVLVVLGLLIIALALEKQTVHKQISNHAEVKTINVTLHDINGTEVTHINWGMVDPNETESFITYVTSDSNVPLVITTEYFNWTPAEMANFTTMYSSLDGVELQPGETRALTFFMFIAAEIVDYEPQIRDFTFVIVVIGDELPI